MPTNYLRPAIQILAATVPFALTLQAAFAHPDTATCLRRNMRRNPSAPIESSTGTVKTFCR